MKKIVLATKNKGKFSEIKKFLGDEFDVLSLEELGIDEDVEETGKNYIENSVLKAVYYARKSKLPALSDDGGLEILAMDGFPGVKSRRWVGHKGTDKELVREIIKIIRKIPKAKRGAYLRTVITLALPNGKSWSVEGKIKGEIVEKPHKSLLAGYPYKSIFYLPKINKYYHESELTESEEKRYNHRYKAIQKIKPIIRKYA